MKDLKIILTACGCPGASTMLRMLKTITERRISVVGTDVREHAIGRFLVDSFYRVPVGRSPHYVDEMVRIVRKERPDILFPVSSYELYPISLNKAKFEELGTEVLVSDPEPIRICNDKALMYETLKGFVDLPKYYVPETLDEFQKYADKLGYPEKPVCFKPTVSKGSRGFRIIKNVGNKADLILGSTETSQISMKDFVEVFEENPVFPRLLLMEYVEGKEYTVDAILRKGKILFSEVKTREEMHRGLAMYFEKVAMPELVDYAQQILWRIPLDYCVNVQTKGGKLLEINPRISTFVYQPDLIQPYLSMKLLRKEIDDEQLKALQSMVKVGLKSVRYYDQVFWS